MSATFVTDLCTAVALSAIFIKPNAWFPVFLVVSLALILVLPRIAPWFFGRYGDRVIEPEIKLVFACCSCSWCWPTWPTGTPYFRLSFSASS